LVDGPTLLGNTFGIRWTIGVSAALNIVDTDSIQRITNLVCGTLTIVGAATGLLAGAVDTAEQCRTIRVRSTFPNKLTATVYAGFVRVTRSVWSTLGILSAETIVTHTTGSTISIGTTFDIFLTDTVRAYLSGLTISIRATFQGIDTTPLNTYEAIRTIGIGPTFTRIDTSTLYATESLRAISTRNTC